MEQLWEICPVSLNRQFPPALSDVVVLARSECLTLRSKTKLALHLSTGTHSLGTLLYYSPNSIWGPTESIFHSSINFLVSITAHLTPQFLLKILAVKIANCRRTSYSFYPVKHPHPLCLGSCVTGDLLCVKCGKKQIEDKFKMRRWEYHLVSTRTQQNTLKQPWQKFKLPCFQASYSVH